MRFTWTRRHAFVAALAIVVLTNTVALIGAAYNRSDPPESMLTLTQRELRPPYVFMKHENSGLALRLRWRVLDRNAAVYQWGQGGSPDWLDAKKMTALGFDTSLPDTESESRLSFRRELPRDVLLVLELDGLAYQEALARAAAQALKLKESPKSEDVTRGDELINAEGNSYSRLFVVDADLDIAPLRAKYPDRSKYAIVRGQVRPTFRGRGSPPPHTGYVNDVSIEAINVPLEMRGAFEGASPEIVAFGPGEKAKVRYEAKVAFGRRLEPWIDAAERK